MQERIFVQPEDVGTRKILVVDDDVEINLLVQMSLEAEGYEVITVFNGKEAVATTRAQRPALVIMDVMMPVMDGFTALRILKEDTATEDIPVLMLTARAEEADILQSWLRGADMYMTKPFDPWQLIANVRTIFSDYAFPTNLPCE